MATISVKIKCFEFLTERLLDWYDSPLHNDFSKLKSFKLLFFTTAVTADRENDGLLTIFDNFWAMPYGHVEKDVYENLGFSQKVVITNNSAIINNISDCYYDEINAYKHLIIDAVELLKKKNSELVFQTAFDLVELSHQWSSWKTSFKFARVQDKLSMPISPSTIKSEPKVFKMVVNEFS